MRVAQEVAGDVVGRVRSRLGKRLAVDEEILHRAGFVNGGTQVIRTLLSAFKLERKSSTAEARALASAFCDALCLPSGEVSS